MNLRFPQARGFVRSAHRSGMTKGEIAYQEHLYAQKVRGEIADYRAQPFSLKLAENAHYRPDFLVILPDGYVELHEVKGGKRDARGNPTYFAEEDSKIKIKIAAEMLPWFTFCIVFRPSVRDGWYRIDISRKEESDGKTEAQVREAGQGS